MLILVEIISEGKFWGNGAQKDIPESILKMRASQAGGGLRLSRILNSVQDEFIPLILANINENGKT